MLEQILGRELIPVLAPIAQGLDGQTYNINADTVAGAVAGALKAKRLLFLTDVPGVLDNNGGSSRNSRSTTSARSSPTARSPAA